MSLDVAINLNALRTIKEELDDTLSHAVTDFESYLVDPSNQGNINSCREALAQIGGIFRLLQYPGSALLADEMAALAALIADPDQKTTESMTNALTHAFFVLPRYVEFITGQQRELPILVIPYANELRAARRETLLPEHHFYQGEIPQLGLMGAGGGNSDIPALLENAPRLRHMYQTGLVGIIKNPKSTGHFQIMRRSLMRFLEMLGSHPSADIWQIASAVHEAFVADKMEITLNRKRVFGEVEKMLRAVVSKGEEGLMQAPPPSLKKDLLFILMLTDVRRPEVNAIREAYSLTTLELTDQDIQAKRNKMHGPSQDTLESVIGVLKEELRSAKDILEVASQNDSIQPEDLDALNMVIQRVADTMRVLNLEGAQQILKEQLTKTAAWASGLDDIGRNEFLEVADTVLYVESALASLDRGQITVEELNKASALTRKKIVANSQLAEAAELVLEEAQSGIALAKRAITAYVDSNFDAAHIANVATTLNTVRGGMKILNYHRAAAVLHSCARFVADNTKQGAPGDQRHQLLETLADALISLEYYISELQSGGEVNEAILEVAEQSLAALGYAVES